MCKLNKLCKCLCPFSSIKLTTCQNSLLSVQRFSHVSVTDRQTEVLTNL